MSNFISAEKALEAIKSFDKVFIHGGAATPQLPLSIIYLFVILNEICVMCTPKCEGNCKNISLKKDSGLKGSIDEIITALEKINACFAKEKNVKNPAKNLFMNNIQILKSEAKLLLEEINSFSCALPKYISGKNTIYDSENIFEQVSFKDRIDQLKRKIHLLETSDLHDTSLTEMNALSF